MAPSALRISRNLHVIKFGGGEGPTARAAARPGLNPRAYYAVTLRNRAPLRGKARIWPVGHGHTSVLIPKFASPCGTLSCELRNLGDTGKLMTLVWFLDLKFLYDARCKCVGTSNPPHCRISASGSRAAPAQADLEKQLPTE